MEAEASPIFVVTLRGLETPGGPPLDVLAFTEAPDEAAAMARAIGEMVGLGWVEVEALRAGEVTDEAALPEDFTDAFAAARRFGCAPIIYDP